MVPPPRRPLEHHAGRSTSKHTAAHPVRAKETRRLTQVLDQHVRTKDTNQRSPRGRSRRNSVPQSPASSRMSTEGQGEWKVGSAGVETQFPIYEVSPPAECSQNQEPDPHQTTQVTFAQIQHMKTFIWLHRDPNQPLRSKRSPVLSQVSDILGASHHGEASPLSRPSELFATWRAFPFRFPSIRHRSPLNNPVLLAASTFCPCGAFCLDAHPSALAGTASSVGLSARTISCCPHSAQGLTSACKATCGRHLNVRNDRCPGEKSACIDGSHCERRVPASPHFSRCERHTFCITYSDLLPGKRAPKSHRVADLGMGQVGREGLSFNHTSVTLEQLTFPTTMGPVTSCRLLFVGCESGDAAATLTQEVLRSSHGHACFRLPFKRMSFFIPGGCLRLEPGSATEQLPLCTCAAAICRSVSLGTQTGFGDETGSVTKAVQLPSTPLPRLENHHRFSGAQQWRERTPQVPGPVETQTVCAQLRKAGRDHARCTVLCKQHTTARGCLTCTRGGGAHQERQDPEKYREALVLKRVSPAERRACRCPRGRPAQLPMSGLTADVTDPSRKALPREAAPAICALQACLKGSVPGLWERQL
ncbi:hypothetical protein MG293_007990 [Ovis ammon polii]|uniref:Uncharacterized protein n=1 Tax=Ovis ammon polii TaxID=230172 RepID=A0AAD4UCL3_OVIAM|nr:hypothetical protein MG293_007990 [Ovis ammon polii]